MMTFNDVPGFNNESHNESLQETARMASPGSAVLEVGTGWGMSTWSLLDALPDGCSLVVLDSFIHPDRRKEFHIRNVLEKHGTNPRIVEAMEVFRKHGQLEAWRHSVGLHPRKGMVEKVVPMASVDFMKTDRREWGMVYLDGNHSYETVSAELAHWGGVPILCGDDYHPVHKGVVAAVDEFRARNPERSFWNDTRPKSGFWRIV